MLVKVDFRKRLIAKNRKRQFLSIIIPKNLYTILLGINKTINFDDKNTKKDCKLPKKLLY